jgi:hypothetical protein
MRQPQKKVKPQKAENRREKTEEWRQDRKLGQDRRRKAEKRKPKG